jgi:hypothetical protein
VLFAQLFPVLLDLAPERREKGQGHVHGDIDILHGHLAVDRLHGGAGVLHGGKGFLVDVCGFDGIDLLFQHGYLAVCLLEGVFVLLLAFEGGAGSCCRERSVVALYLYFTMYSEAFNSLSSLPSQFIQWAIAGVRPAYLSCL